jgi:serine/threonine-protein kinase
MGEVYRADDLKLGQAVALKFLPAIVENDAARLQRFLNEAKIARQISHPNVCRVYDVGEVNGHHYLSMEYVDGEDLASLLRRIGRLPKDKAVQISRQLCAGLAAAHEQGILHRDLKPANVMIDGRGRARITDFGLATLAGTVRADEVGAGTALYMAPEQRAGKDVTVRSDLYSLGLVLYELFTGHRAFKASTSAELARLQAESTPTSPTRLIEDLDPTVERAILRCLQKEPRDRPASALIVAASLPGGDPLAAALAAGETPSPEMVAAAGEEGALAPAKAWALLGTVVVALGGVLFVARYSNLLRLAPVEDPPQVLAAHARDIVRRLGYTTPPGDTAYWLAVDNQYMAYRAEHLPSPQRTRELASAARHPVLFYYRQSPWPLATWTPDPVVEAEDPPHDLPGMISVVLDGGGRLTEFRAVPPEFDDSKGPWAVPDWSPLFAEAGLDAGRFTRVDPRWRPLETFDTQASWDGSAAKDESSPLHVVAAAFRGKPVFFRVIGPWVPTEATEEEPTGERGAIARIIVLCTPLLILVVGIVIARRNLRLGRGDRKGAFRLAVAWLLTGILNWILTANHVSAVARELTSFVKYTAITFFFAGSIWACYIALEPFVRRQWPQLLFSWTRLLSGRFRDPLVGRDVLIGTAFGAFLGVVRESFFALPAWFNVSGLSPRGFDRAALGGPSEVAGDLASLAGFAMVLALAATSLLFMFRLVLRKDWLAILVAGLLLSIAGLGFAGAEQVSILLALLRAVLANGLILFVLLRYGILALAALSFTANVILAFPMTLDFSRWYAGSSLAALLVILGLAAYGAYTSLAGRPIFGAASLDD